MLDNVSKVFSGGVVAVDDVSLEIASGEFLVLVGPSGCGKSTLLRMIAGLEDVTGRARSRSATRDVTDLPPRARDIAMVFQSYALYPHMTVRENLGYGLKVRKTPKQEVEQRVDEVAELLGLEPLLDRQPGRALGRPAPARRDGPRDRARAEGVPHGRAALEPRREAPREHARPAVERCTRGSATTTIYVTHDQVEAMTLGQRVAVMRDGQIQQVDTPQALYAPPANLFVAAFIGSPAMNLVEAELADGVLELRRLPDPAAADAAPQRRGDRRHPARGVRGCGVRRPVAAADRREGRGRRGARRGHACASSPSTRRPWR